MKKITMAVFIWLSVQVTGWSAVAPFGQVIGKATIDSATAELSRKGRVHKGLIDAVTGASMLRIHQGFGLGPGERATFVFDENDVLASVKVDLTGRHEHVLANLKAKYAPAPDQNVALNDSTTGRGMFKDSVTTFRDGSVYIRIRKPFLGPYSVLYVTQAYAQRFRAIKTAKAKAKREGFLSNF